MIIYCSVDHGLTHLVAATVGLLKDLNVLNLNTLHLYISNAYGGQTQQMTQPDFKISAYFQRGYAESLQLKSKTKEKLRARTKISKKKS